MKKENKEKELLEDIGFEKTKTIELNAKMSNRIASGKRVATILIIILIFASLILLIIFGISLT